MIDHYLYDVEQTPEKYFFSLLLATWRSMDDLKMGCETYTEAFNVAKGDLKEGVDCGNARLEST